MMTQEQKRRAARLERLEDQRAKERTAQRRFIQRQKRQK